MPRIVLLLAVLATAYLLYRRVQALPPHKRRGEMLRIAVGVAVVAVVLLTLAGKMHWVGAALTGLLVAARQALPVLLRLFPVLAQWRQQSAGAQPAGGGQSTVKTRTLAMHLDHDSGALSGEVLAGPWQDWRLDEMDRSQLGELRRWCAAEDPEAVQLLDSYLEQRFPGEAPGDGGDGERAQQESQDNGGMTRSEALAVLGLGEAATRDDIIAAHRRLMQKLHPDRGGNDYLAAKVNEAKDLLLR
ncbi:MAG TPA: molecular chaperone DnaJ [Halieaceae bacterium]|nr:molecular chaperone DnaJ [Halieaceae bacterium]